MSARIGVILNFVLLLIGAGITLVFPVLGIPLLILGMMALIWLGVSFAALKQLERLVPRRIHVHFKEAIFDAVGMSSPYIDFLFVIHSCLSTWLFLSGKHRGDLWNPGVEAWHSDWIVDGGPFDSDEDSEIRIRWHVEQGLRSPMTEFAYRAKDSPPEKDLAFEDMQVGLKAKVLWIERDIGWLRISEKGHVVTVKVPDHSVFDSVRQQHTE